MKRRLRAGFIALALAVALAACEAKPPQVQPKPELDLAPASFADLPGWPDDAVSAALPALARSCLVLAAKPDATPAGPAGTPLRARDWRGACTALARVPAADDRAARAYVERWFRPFRASNRGDARGLFTGYFEIALDGARKPGGRYTVPLYGVPRDLVSVDLGAFDDSLRGKHIAGHVVESPRGAVLEPYPTRAEIEAGALAGKAPVLAWVDDPIDAFFLSIQGSGRVTLRDGTVLRLGYAGQNGRRYRSVGKILVERGAMALEDVSLQSIRAWMRAHPDQAKPLMDQDAGYVFYRLLGPEGPLGAEGVALTPGRSLAVDPAFVSLGTPIWLDAEGAAGVPPIRRLVIAQDTGSAIKGPVRGDLFWGYGPEAERAAGHMRAQGSYFLLLPRAVPSP